MASADVYTLSLHDALPISLLGTIGIDRFVFGTGQPLRIPEASVAKVDLLDLAPARRDRKSTRLNSSHTVISYAVFCLKKKTAMWPNRTWRIALTAIRSPKA